MFSNDKKKLKKEGKKEDKKKAKKEALEKKNNLAAPSCETKQKLNIFATGSEPAITIEECVAYDQLTHPELDVETPLIFSHCLTFLMERGLDTTGLFRVPGNFDRLKYYVEEYNAGAMSSSKFEDSESPETIASLLKKYLREIPDIPLFTKEYDQEFQALISNQNMVDCSQKYRNLIQQIPVINQRMIKQLLNYLVQVNSNANSNLMGLENLSIVFGEMAGIFSSGGKAMVIWLIEHYYELYEFSDITVAKRPMVLRKLVGHTGSVISLNCYKNFIISFDSHGIIRMWLTDSWNEEGEAKIESAEEAQPVQRTDHHHNETSDAATDVSSVTTKDSEATTIDDSSQQHETPSDTPISQSSERIGAQVGVESESNTGASSGDLVHSTSGSTVATSGSESRIAALRRPSSRNNKAAILGAPLSLSEQPTMSNSANQILAKSGPANLFGKLAGLEGGETLGSDAEIAKEDEVRKESASSSLADSSEEAIAALRRPSRPLSSNRTTSAKLLMYLERTESSNARSDVFDNLSPRYHVDLSDAKLERADSTVIAQLSPRYQEKMRQQMARDEITSSGGVGLSGSTSTSARQSPSKTLDKERSLERQQQFKARPKFGRESSDPYASKTAQKQQDKFRPGSSKQTRVTGHERAASDNTGGVSFDLKPISIPNNNPAPRRELVSSAGRPSSNPDVTNLSPRDLSPRDRGDMSPRDRERHHVQSAGSNANTPPISPRGQQYTSNVITSEAEGVYSLPGKQVKHRMPDGSDFTSSNGMFRKSPRVPKRGVANLNQLFSDAMTSDADDSHPHERLPPSRPKGETPSVPFISSEFDHHHLSQPTVQPRRPSVGPPPRVSRSEPQPRQRSLSEERTNVGGSGTGFMEIEFDRASVPVSRGAPVSEPKRMIPSKSDGNVNQITRKTGPSTAFTATAPLGAGHVQLVSPRAPLGRLGVLSNHRGADPALRSQPQIQLELKIENPFYFRFYHSYNLNDRFNFRPIITNHYLWLIVKAMIKVWPMDKLLATQETLPSTIPEFFSFEMPKFQPTCLCAVGDSVWVGGNQLLVVTFSEPEFSSTALSTDSALTNRFFYITLKKIGENIWAAISNKVEVWNIATQSLIHTVVLDDSVKVNEITSVEENVWLSGTIRSDGKTWVINSKTYEVIATLRKESGPIYASAKIGPLVWTLAWDCSIDTWSAVNNVFVESVQNFHRDAIVSILVIEKKKGYIVWTGSSDKTINVMFVPKNYYLRLVSKCTKKLMKLGEVVPSLSEFDGDGYLSS